MLYSKVVQSRTTKRKTKAFLCRAIGAKNAFLFEQTIYGGQMSDINCRLKAVCKNNPALSTESKILKYESAG
jgi:hypothetical protein